MTGRLTAVGLLLLLAACSGGGSKALAPTTTSSTTSSTESPTTVTTEDIPTTPTLPAGVHELGYVATIDGGKANLAVVQVKAPAQSDQPYLHPAAGKQYTALMAKACGDANESGDSTFGPLVALQLADDTRVMPTVSAVQPPLNPGALAPGQCLQGWITYEVPQGATATAAVWMGQGATFGEVVEWKLA